MEKLTYRKAIEQDVPTIIEMLNNDALGRTRETFSIPLPSSYQLAFDKIDADPNQQLMVVEMNGEIIGTFQLTYIQYLTYKGGMRVLAEAVRVKDTYRSQGIGRAIFEYIIKTAKKKGAHMVQLTTNKLRSRAIPFYESLGFVGSHEGMKLHF